MAQLLAGQILRATDIVTGPTFVELTPVGNLDESGAVLDAWSGTASLAVPNWASTAIVQSSVSAATCTGADIGARYATRIGAVTGKDVAESITVGLRKSHSWGDEIDVSAVAGTTSTIEVYARVSSGGGTLRADTSSDFSWLVWFAA